MLISYSVSNFLSFKEKQTLNMFSGKGQRLESHIIKEAGRKRILKGQVCFGANGSGKTNLIKSIAFARNMIMNGLPNEDTEKKVFRGHLNLPETNTCFSFHFEYHGKEILYEVEVDLYKRIIKKEEAILVPLKKRIFSRLYNDGYYVIKKDDGIKKKKEDEERYSIYIDDFKRETTLNSNSKVFFAIDVAKKAPNKSSFFSLFYSIAMFFDSILPIYTNSYYTQIMRHVENEDENKDLISFLNTLDVNISRLHNEVVDKENVLINLDDDKKQRLYSKLDQKNGVFYFKGNGGNLYALKKDQNNNIIAEKMQIKHGDSCDFDSSEESDGILRLFDFAPLLMGCSADDELILIDEIDRSLHTIVTKKLIDLIFNSKDKKTQFIITSHDADLIDLNLLRQDEITLVDMMTTETQLHSLRDKNLRYDKKIVNDYIQGTLGGVPNIK